MNYFDKQKKYTQDLATAYLQFKDITAFAEIIDDETEEALILVGHSSSKEDEVILKFSYKDINCIKEGESLEECYRFILNEIHESLHFAMENRQIEMNKLMELPLLCAFKAICIVYCANFVLSPIGFRVENLQNEEEPIYFSEFIKIKSYTEMYNGTLDILVSKSEIRYIAVINNIGSVKIEYAN